MNSVLLHLRCTVLSLASRLGRGQIVILRVGSLLAARVLGFDFRDGQDLGGGPGLVDSTVHRSHCAMNWKLTRGRGRTRERLARIEVDIAIEVLELLRRYSVGILVKYFLSNDCVSLLSRNRCALLPLAAIKMRSLAGRERRRSIDCRASTKT